MIDRLLTIGLLVPLLWLHAAAPEPLVSVGVCETPPTLDGRLDDSCWRHCLEMGGFAVAGTHTAARAQTHAFFTRDDTHLYVGIRADQLDMGALKPASRVRDDADMWRNDCVELFIDRNGDRRTFVQLMINRLGTLYDARCDMGAARDARTDVSWDSGAKVAAGADETGWTVEAAIPLDALGGPVAEGDVWRVNLVRDNPSDGEASTWVPLDEHKWHAPEQFATLRFVARTPGLRFGPASASAEGERFAFEVTSSGAQHHALSLDIPPYAHQRRDLAPKPGETVQTSLDYNSSGWRATPKDGLAITLSTDGETLFRWVRRHLRPFIEVTVAPLPNGDQSPRCISLDWPTQIQTVTRHTFPGARPPAQCVDRRWRIVVEAPQGIRAGEHEPVRTVQRDGQTFEVYEVPMRKVHCGANWHNFTIRTSLPPGERHTLWYYADWGEGRQEPQPLPVRTIAVGRTAAPRRLVTGFYNYYLARLEQMDMVRLLRDCGVNCMSVGRVRDPKVYDAVRNLGMFMREGDYFWPGKMQGWSDWPKNDPDARNLDANGYPTVGKGGHQLCPSYRGPEFAKAMAATRARVAESGVNWFAFDMEGYVMPAGDQGCFCDRCLEAFHSYRARRFPQLTDLGPKDFERAPEAHPEHHAAWVAFKDAQWGGLFLAMKDAVADVVGRTCPKSGPALSEWSFGQPWDTEAVHRTYRGWEFVKAFDWFEVSAYSGVQRFVEEQIERERRLAEDAPEGLRVDWIFTPSPRRLSPPGGQGYYSTDVMEHPDELKYKILEAAAFGAKGVYVWRFSDADADSMRQWVAGVAAIARVENVVLDGERIEDARSSNPRVDVRGMQVGREAAILVAEYRTADPVATTVTYPVEAPSRVRDLETGEIVAEITPERPTFSVALPPERRARLLHVFVPGAIYDPQTEIKLSGPRASADEPDAAAEREKPTDGPEALPVQFRHESFATMLDTAIPARGAIHSHGALVGGEWQDDVWTYWTATAGDGPETWALLPMHWDMHTRWAKEWKGLFAARLAPDGYVSPFATADRVYIAKPNPAARVAAVALRNPFDRTVQARVEGNIRIHKTTRGVDVFVYVRTLQGAVTPVTSTRDPKAIGWNGHSGKPDREYLRLNASVTLEPGALLVFAGHIAPERLAAAEGRDIFEMFADNDRWGPLYRPNITLR